VNRHLFTVSLESRIFRECRGGTAT
jgi:hypothetical protein